jgi:DNA polymerase-3 subunit gamma/tau
MATQALYRRWRSRKFDEVIGQEHVTRTLQNALATDRVAHAYLFTGPRGTGKTTTARLLAKAVNCLGDGPTKPCGECRICRAVDEGRLLDMIEIDAASNRGIDEIRDLREKVGFRPGEARVKFYIIDEVHMLTDPAFNALLKTLEEPPPHVIFVLATTEPHKIPMTIVSRCQRFDFRRIPLAEITRWLAHIAEAEGLSIEPSALEYIARQGGGSMRDAISLLDQLTAYGSDTITLAQVQAVLGAVTSQSVMDLADSLIERDLARGLDVINRVIGDGAEPRQFTRDFVEYLRGLLLLKMGDGASLLRASVSDETLAQMQAQAPRLTPRTLLRATRLFNEAALEMKAGFLPQLPLELAFVESALDDGAEPEPPATSPPARSQAPTSSPAQSRPVSSTSSAPKAEPPPAKASPSPAPAARSTPPPAAEQASPAVAGSLSFGAVESKWPDILARLRQADKMVEALVRSVRLAGAEGTSVILEVPSDLLKGRIEQPNAKSHIERCMGEVLGVPARLRCVVKGKSPLPLPAVASSSLPPSAGEANRSSGVPSSGRAAGAPGRAGAEEDPMLRAALDLGGQIKDPD